MISTYTADRDKYAFIFTVLIKIIWILLINENTQTQWSICCNKGYELNLLLFPVDYLSASFSGQFRINQVFLQMSISVATHPTLTHQKHILNLISCVRYHLHLRYIHLSKTPQMYRAVTSVPLDSYLVPLHQSN